jgi:hypothetical protein
VADARFRMSSRGVGQLLRSPMLEAEMMRRGELIKSVAESISPVGDAARDPHPGLYRDSWYVVASNKQVGRTRKRRATATVGNSAPYARWVEYGNEHYSGRHVLLRAAMAGGH